MSMQDPISDMLTRIRNAQMAKKSEVKIPFSNEKLAIVKVVLDEGFINSYEIVELGNKKIIQITLKYYKEESVITEIKRISRPGLRIYKKRQDLPRVVGGLGIAIISTSKGVMSDRKARIAKTGGEVLCYIW